MRYMHRYRVGEVGPFMRPLISSTSSSHPKIDALTSSWSLPAGYAAADHTIATALCPGGKERMGRLLAVAPGSIDLKPLVTHGLKLNEIERVFRQSG